MGRGLTISVISSFLVESGSASEFIAMQQGRTLAPVAGEEGATETPPEIPELNDESSSDSGSSAESDSELGEIPVNETNPNPNPENTAAAAEPAPAAATPAPAGAAPNALFSGGQNHFIHGMKKNKTHRHHKRRNRHHTLRKK